MATITWQNVNAIPNYEGTSLLKTSADLANLSFKQLGSALDKGANIIGEHVDDKLQQEVMGIQEGQKKAAENIRSSIFNLEGLAGISSVDSLTGKVNLASADEILSTYKGDPNDQAAISAYIAGEQEKAARAAKQFSETDFGLMSSGEYDDLISKTALGIGKSPEEVKMLQESFKLDLNKEHGLTQSDQMELAATKARADLLNAMNQKEYELKKNELGAAARSFENDMEPYKNKTVDQFGQEFFGGTKGWKVQDVNEVVRNMHSIGAEVAEELANNPAYVNLLIGGKRNKDGTWDVPPRLSDDILNRAMGELPVGEGGIWGAVLDGLRMNKQIGGDQKEEIKKKLHLVARNYQGYYDSLAKSTALDQQFLISQNENSERSMNTLANLERRMKSDAKVIDGALWRNQ